MAGFGGGKAVASGFRLIAREPLAILAWAGVYLVLGILPQVGIWPQMARLMQTSGEMDQRMLAELNAAMLGYQPVIWLCSILMYTLVYGAIYRAILEPDNRRYFYLRLGMQELWMLLSSAVVLILGVIAIFIVAIPIGIVGSLAGQGASATGLTFLLGCAVFLLVFWLAMRFALAGVMAFAQRRFVLLESWRLTRGHGLKMMGVAFALFCIVLGVELVFGLAVFLSLYPMINGGEAALTKALGDPTTLVTRWAPWIVVLCLVGSIVIAAFYAVLAAPWASIYRDLTDGEAAAEV
jgi:hypothetical protein